MDYIPETMYRVLRYYVKMKMAFPDALGKIYAYQMFRSLAYIHSLGICHRDIKPQNILVDTQTHRVVMCDFGSAKKLQPGETSVAYICSRYYRAPELILGEEQYSVEIDIWSIAGLTIQIDKRKQMIKKLSYQRKKLSSKICSDNLKNYHYQ